MRWAINLGRWFGIKVLVHWTFFLILIWIGWGSYSMGQDIYGFLFTTILVFTVFFCVILHELGHALTARRYGIGTRWIVLLPIGGVAQLEKMPEEPREELIVAIMGPAVNVVIFIVLVAALSFIIPPQISGNTYEELASSSLVYLEDNPHSTFSFLLKLALVNVFLVVFNIIPAFPMDGGRILRAVLASRMDYVKATNIAARIGQGFAILFALMGIFVPHPILVIIAIFIYLGAQGEATMVKNKFIFRGFNVHHGMLSRFKTLHPENTLHDAVKELLAGSDKDFIVADEEDVRGILTRDKLVEALSAHGNSTRIAQVMITDFPVLSPHENLDFAISQMRDLKLPILPVKRNGVLIGAISMDNVAEFFLVNKNEEVDERMSFDAG